MKSSSDSIGIDNTQGDVIASKVEGMGTIAGKEVHVTIEGNVFNIGNALQDNIKEILESSSSVPKDDDTPLENSQRIQKAKASEKNIQEIIHVLERIEEKEGITPKKIKAGEYDISTDYLLEKKHLLDGNKCFFKREYDKAIEYYDKAIDINAYDADAWYNKGSALEGLKKYDEAIRCYDNAIDIEPGYTKAWYSKGNFLYQKTAKQKIIISMTFNGFISIITFLLLGFNYQTYEIVGWFTVLTLPITAFVISVLFLFFFYKEGIMSYRRLDDRIKKRILIFGIASIIYLWGIYLALVLSLPSIMMSLGPNDPDYYGPIIDRIITVMPLINLYLTINFFLFLYNMTSRGEYYLNKAKELGKRNL